MYVFFDNVPSNPTSEILKLKLQSSSCPGAARCNVRFGELKPGSREICNECKENIDRLTYMSDAGVVVFGRSRLLGTYTCCQ